MEILIVICSLMSILISLPALVISLYTLTEIKAFKKSTHQIQYVPAPVPDLDANISEKQKKEFMEGFQPDMTEDFLI